MTQSRQPQQPTPPPASAAAAGRLGASADGGAGRRARGPRLWRRSQPVDRLHHRHRSSWRSSGSSSSRAERDRPQPWTVDLNATTIGDLVTYNPLVGLLLAVIYTAISAGYFIYMWTTMRATLGQRVLGLQVGNAANGATITQEQAHQALDRPRRAVRHRAGAQPAAGPGHPDRARGVRLVHRAALHHGHEPHEAGHPRQVRRDHRREGRPRPSCRPLRSHRNGAGRRTGAVPLSPDRRCARLTPSQPVSGRVAEPADGARCDAVDRIQLQEARAAVGRAVQVVVVGAANAPRGVCASGHGRSRPHRARGHHGLLKFPGRARNGGLTAECPAPRSNTLPGAEVIADAGAARELGG